MVYIHIVRRIQLYMDDDLDHALTAEAARSGRSRSELVRMAVRQSLEHKLTVDPDPIDALIGSVDIDPIDDIDAAIYLQ
ncbi:CopG family transcriptional regulator [Candidatus Poriferisocius sp.]|uniref:ribbon-helix-helix domain-containing protein n=1 Tax=Candidatus Poriferisocius sp. TaxID=3101276 RepID=UPI003B01FC3F